MTSMRRVTSTSALPQRFGDQQDGTFKIIQQLSFLLDDTRFIKKRLIQVDRLEEQIENIAHIVEEIDRRTEHLEHRVHNLSINSKRGRPTSQPRRRIKSTSNKDVSSLLDLPEAVQENISLFVEDMLVEETQLPDKLIENECLTEDEYCLVSSRPSRKDQIRLLVQTVRKKGPKYIRLFLDQLDEYPHIQKAVEQSLESIRTRKRNRKICTVCLMKKTVDYKDVADSLWSKHLIPDNLYDRLIQPGGYQDKLLMWNSVIRALGKCSDSEIAIIALRNSLQQKYPHIAENLQGKSLQVLQCDCAGKMKRHLMPPLGGSQSDTSTSFETERFRSDPWFGSEYGGLQRESLSLSSSSEFLRDGQDKNSWSISSPNSLFANKGSVKSHSLPSHQEQEMCLSEPLLTRLPTTSSESDSFPIQLLPLSDMPVSEKPSQIVTANRPGSGEEEQQESGLFERMISSDLTLEQLTSDPSRVFLQFIGQAHDQGPAEKDKNQGEISSPTERPSLHSQDELADSTEVHELVNKKMNKKSTLKRQGVIIENSFDECDNEKDYGVGDTSS